jgi:predicted phage gp36 major capsid-like protein
MQETACEMQSGTVATEARNDAKRHDAARPRMALGVRLARGRRVHALADALASKLGGWTAMNDLQAAAVRRAAELVAIAEQARLKHLRGEQGISLEDLVRLDSACDRALRRLGLSKPSAPKPGAKLDEHLARLASRSTSEVVSE